MAYPLLLHARHRDGEVTYQPFGSWVVPWRYDRFDAEYQALRNGAGLIDFSCKAAVELRGKDRANFLHNLLSNDIKRLTPGGGCQAALLTPNAKLIADLIVLMDAEATWLLCDAECVMAVFQTLEKYLFSEQIAIINHERKQAVLALQGPRALECLIQVSGTVVAVPRPCDHQPITIEGIPVRIIRHSLTGGVGVLCLVEEPQAKPLWDILFARGVASGMRLAGWEALNTSRIEAGIPWFGIDINEDNLLPETGLETVMASDTKGCYVGQEVVARLGTYGSVSKKLVGLKLKGKTVPEAGSKILRDKEEVGWVTSACYSPTLSLPIALGFIKRGSFEPETPVEIAAAQERIPATVVKRPLIDFPETPAARLGLSAG